MFRDIKFTNFNEGNIFTRIISVDFNELIDNQDYLMQIFSVISVGYDSLLIEKPFSSQQSLLSYLKNFDKDINFKFIYNLTDSRKNNVEISII